MTDLRFDDDYKPGLWTGTALHDRLVQEGKTELVPPPITGVDRQTFTDTEKPEWVIHFGPDEPALRLRKSMYQAGVALRDSFGNNAKDWTGRQIALSAEMIEWQDRETRENKSGYTIRVRPIPLNAYAEAAGNGQPAALTGRRALDDDLPF